MYIIIIFLVIIPSDYKVIIDNIFRQCIPNNVLSCLKYMNKKFSCLEIIPRRNTICLKLLNIYTAIIFFANN